MKDLEKIQEIIDQKFIAQLKQIVHAARSKAYSAINFTQVEANWLIGQRIVEQEQEGKARAEYGKYVIRIASQELTAEFGKGYSKTNLKNCRQFYLMFSDFKIGQALPDQLDNGIGQAQPDQLNNVIGQALPDQLDTVIGQAAPDQSKNKLVILSWTHYERLLRVENPEARHWYMNEAAEQMWSYRTLDRNINTQYYERLLLSQIKEPVMAEMKDKTKIFQQDKLAFIKNPTMLEFLGVPDNNSYMEKDIEKAIIDNLQKFLMELGKGFAFVARQQLIRTEAEDYYIDLTFYNYILKCFVLIDLKMGKISHQDVGQMDMYVRMFDELKRGKDDNPTIGIVLCSETDNDIARYSILKENEQLFASKYKFYLPTENELRAEIDRQKEMLKMQFKK
ncbi:MAG: PDDEXK nuclease domain-containing protein [Prevotellaceae bacterium]|jgi:predicted nuclease of restriction endonuclease-like (RecB) superfamily|nr:PDDEXK nuclease domain-containing protein [Prevotellaceae bacterium]